MGKKVAGTAYIKVDGMQLTVTGGAEAPLMDKKRETVYPGLLQGGGAGALSENDRPP